MSSQYKSLTFESTLRFSDYNTVASKDYVSKQKIMVVSTLIIVDGEKE